MDLKRNLSTEHQLPGDAKRPDDALLDKPRTPEDEDGERGRRPAIAGNGEVHGSGSGAGGGGAAEDYDGDPAGGRGGLVEAPDASNGEEDRLHQAVETQGHPVSPEDYPEPNLMPQADKGMASPDR